MQDDGEQPNGLINYGNANSGCQGPTTPNITPTLSQPSDFRRQQQSEAVFFRSIIMRGHMTCERAFFKAAHLKQLLDELPREVFRLPQQTRQLRTDIGDVRHAQLDHAHAPRLRIDSERRALDVVDARHDLAPPRRHA